VVQPPPLATLARRRCAHHVQLTQLPTQFPAPDDLLATREGSTAVNNVRNDGADLIEPAV
jgi:hypothetical protein